MTARQIKRLRIRLGLTQQQMASGLFIAVKTIANWERGRARPFVLYALNMKRESLGKGMWQHNAVELIDKAIDKNGTKRSRKNSWTPRRREGRSSASQ